MRTLIVYESMYGNTRTTAERIAEGLRSTGEVVVVPVAEASPEQVAGADLVVVGGPTHMHGLTSSLSRKMAKKAAEEPGSDLEVLPGTEGPGVRDWLHAVGGGDGRRAAAFDTRIAGSPAMTGRAGHGIARRLRHHGFTVVRDPESFLVDKESHLLPGEEERATAWGAELGSAVLETR